MALLASMYLRGAKQRLGGAVLYSSAGRTIARELAASVSNPRTPSQMGQRVKWANLVAFYRANKAWMKKAYETRKPTQSDYNVFMQKNVAGSSIYLTKQDAAQGACVVGEFQISEGSLPSVEVNQSGEDWYTNLFVGENFSLSAETTVGALAATLLENNNGLKLGDQISLIRVTQSMNNQTGVPFVQVRQYEMLLNPNSADLVYNFMPADIFVTDAGDQGQCISIANNYGTGAFALIVSRTIAGRTLVSTQRLVTVNMSVILQQYTSAEMLEAAIASYGASEEVFLDSNAADYPTGGQTTMTLLWLVHNNVKYLPNDYFGSTQQLANSTINIVFNKSITKTVEHVWIDGTDRTFGVNGSTKAGNILMLPKDLSGSELPEGKLRSIRVEMGGATYEFPFKLEDKTNVD